MFPNQPAPAVPSPQAQASHQYTQAYAHPHPPYGHIPFPNPLFVPQHPHAQQQPSSGHTHAPGALSGPQAAAMNMLAPMSDGGQQESDEDANATGHGGSSGNTGGPAGVNASSVARGGNGSNHPGVSDAHRQHHAQQQHVDDDDQDHEDGVEHGPSDPNMTLASGQGQTEEGPPKKKRRRQALSCTECKRRKIKCDRNNPCGPCTRRGEGDRCRWVVQEPVEKFVTRQEWDELRQKLIHLETIVAQLAPRAFPHLLGGIDMNAAALAAAASGMSAMPPGMISFGFHPPGYPAAHPHPGAPGAPHGDPAQLAQAYQQAYAQAQAQAQAHAQAQGQVHVVQAAAAAAAEQARDNMVVDKDGEAHSAEEAGAEEDASGEGAPVTDAQNEQAAAPAPAGGASGGAAGNGGRVYPESGARESNGSAPPSGGGTAPKSKGGNSSAPASGAAASNRKRNREAPAS